MNLDFFVPYVGWLIAGIIFLIGLYIKTYVSESAKIKVLKNENAALIKQTEEIKKEYQLDITKRKYQYESKKEQYLKFFSVIDKFSQDTNKDLQEKTLIILNEFYKNYLNSSNNNNKKNQVLAVTVMSKKIQNLMIDSNLELMKLKHETNTIKLIASDKIINILKLFEYAYEKSIEEANKMMEALPALVIVNDQIAMAELRKKVEIAGLVVQNVKNDIIKQMRIELGEI